MRRERATLQERRTAYPTQWGLPEGDPDSEQRVAWVRRNVRAWQKAKSRRSWLQRQLR